MMTKNKTRSIAYKLAMVPILTTLLFYFISCSKESDNIDSIKINNTEAWWNPILAKHNIAPTGYNNFENVFEMGTKNSINNRLVTLEDAVFIIKTNNNGYIILNSPLAYHNLNSDLINGEYGTIKIFNSIQDEKPTRILSLKNFKYQLRNQENLNDLWYAREIDIIVNP